MRLRPAVAGGVPLEHDPVVADDKQCGGLTVLQSAQADSSAAEFISWLSGDAVVHSQAFRVGGSSALKQGAARQPTYTRAMR